MAKAKKSLIKNITFNCNFSTLQKVFDIRDKLKANGSFRKRSMDSLIVQAVDEMHARIC